MALHIRVPTKLPHILAIAFIRSSSALCPLVLLYPISLHVRLTALRISGGRPRELARVDERPLHPLDGRRACAGCQADGNPRRRWRGPGESQVRAKWLCQVQALVRQRLATPRMPQELCDQGIQPIRMATRAPPIPERLTQVLGRVRHRKMTDEPT